MPRTLALILSLCLTPPGVPRAAAAELNYALYVLGVPVADAELFDEAPSPAYRVTLRFHTTGLAGVIANYQLEMQAIGTYENGRLAPLAFRSSSRLRGQDRYAGLAWRDGTPVVTAITPADGAEREEVAPAARANAIDPASSLALLLRETARTGRCEAASHGYDGHRLQSYQVQPAGEADIPPSDRSSFSGRALRCAFSEQTVAGFRRGAGREEDARRRVGTIWLARVFPGSGPLPVQASIETRLFGQAMIYLKSASP